MKKSKVSVIVLLVLMVTLMSGCKKKVDTLVVLPEGSYKIYYVNSSGTGLVWETYESEQKDPEILINDLLKQLSTDPEHFSYKRALTDNIVVKSTTLEEHDLTVDFDSTYSNEDSVNRAFARAAIVKTLTQIQGVTYVDFYINGAPMVDPYEKPVSQLTDEDFIDDKAIKKSLIPADITIYFSNESGKKLVECEETQRYNGSITMEQFILMRLIDGPDELEKEAGMKAVIPSDTVVNNVTTKEGVCYVDFSKEFLNPVDDVNEKVSLYAVINSLVELNNINKVQIMIDGKIIPTYRDSIELDKLFERDLGIIEGTK